MGWVGLSCGLFQTAPPTVYNNWFPVALTNPRCVTHHSCTPIRNKHSATKGYRELCFFSLGHGRLMSMRFKSGKRKTTINGRKRLVTRASSRPSSKPPKVTVLVLAFTLPLLLAGAAALVGIFIRRRIHIQAMQDAEEMGRLQAEGLLDASIIEKLEADQKKILDGKPIAEGTRRRPKREE